MPRARLLIGCWIVVALFSACSLLILIRRTTLQAGRRPLLRNEAEPAHVSRPAPDDTFVAFDVAPGRQARYPWHQLHLGRWRRRLLVAGAVEADRPVAAGPEAVELGRVLRRAAAQLRTVTGDPGYRPADCIGGRLRLLPGLGVQYEIYFRDRAAAAEEEEEEEDSQAAADGSSVDSSPVVYHTVRLQRPLQPLQVQRGSRRRASRLVHIVLPYYNRAAALEAFLTRFTKLAQSRELVTLTVVRFSEGLPAMTDAEEGQDQSSVRALVAAALQTLGEPVPRVRLLEEAGPFSAGAGWLTSAEVPSAQDHIVMLGHVDLLFGKEFLQRCRANSLPGQRAYYPVVFSMFNPSIAYGVLKKKVISIQQNYEKDRLIDQTLGYWLDTDYGVSCQYLSDFRRFSDAFRGGNDSDLNAMLFERYVKSGMEVIRLPDPDLVQVYRKVTCMREMGREQFNTCLKTKAMNEASSLEWGLWVYKNMGDTDEVQTFLNIVKMSANKGPVDG